MTVTNLSGSIHTLGTLIEQSKIPFVFETTNPQTGMPVFTALGPIDDRRDVLIRVEPNLLKEIPGFNYQDQTRNMTTGEAWMVRDGAAVIQVESKAKLVEVLTTLGVTKEQLKQIKTVKTSELRELVGEGGTSNDEIETIALRLQKKNDSIKLAVENNPQVTCGAYKGVRIEVSEQQYNHGLAYTVIVDCLMYLQDKTTSYREQIQKAGARILPGFLGGHF
jgi:hypothetical protein